MITEDYVSFEVAKLLKEKGFNDDNIRYGYNEYGKVCEPVVGWRKVEPFYLRPTLQMAMKWLREVHNIHINLLPFDIETRISTRIVRYLPEIYTLPQKGHELDCIGMNVCDTCEKACEAALKYSLENLI